MLLFAFGIMADHPRSAFHSLYSVNSNHLFVVLIVPKILKCIDFGVLLETSYSRAFLGSSPGIFFPHNVLGQKHVVWAIKHKNQCNGSTWVQDPEKSTGQQKSQVLYFPYLGGRLHWTDSTLTLHGGWCPRRNHVCQVSNWNLHGLRFYRGLNFRFLYW